jgi:polyhydroxyalkanoate synthase
VIKIRARTKEATVLIKFISQFVFLSLLCFLTNAWCADAPFVSRKLHWAVTEKKFELAMERFRLTNLRQRTPVVLIHGLLVNSHFFNLTREHSLAQYLAEEGFDVWNLSLRGTGRSLKPLKAPPKKWSLDDMINDDLSPVISYVQRQSGSPRVNWVGFDMGGLLLYGYLDKKRRRSGIGALVTIGTPVTFNDPKQEPMKALLKLEDHPTWKKILLYLDAPLVQRLLIPRIPTIEKFFYNPENMNQEVKQRFLETALAPINPGVLDHVITMVRKGEFVSATGNHNYRKNLSKIRVPLLIIGGEKDPVAPPQVLRATYRELKSRDRTRRIFGSRPKDLVAYGHYDLILGKKAKEEVFPLIGSWLKKRSR